MKRILLVLLAFSSSKNISLVICYQVAVLLSCQFIREDVTLFLGWLQDHALVVRLQHIVHCVERAEWPVSRAFSAYAAGEDELGETPVSTPRSISDNSEVITINTDASQARHATLAAHLAHHTPQSVKKKRHIAIDVETERGQFYLRNYRVEFLF